jgi:biopolymer transport protein ExbD
MSMSMRAKRKYRKEKRKRPLIILNLVSLVDMFTILLCFLLVNAPDGEVLENEHNVNLPESVSEVKPTGHLMLTVTTDDIKIAGQTVMTVAQAVSDGQVILPALQQVLNNEAAKTPYLTEEAKEKGRFITVMGDSAVSYALLKKIMATCAQSEYRNISLAINQIDAAPPAAAGGT